MSLVPSPGFALRGKSRWPNLIVFPKELRAAIPDYGARALVFDSVSGSPAHSPLPLGVVDPAVYLERLSRTRIELLVHETGKLDGKFTLLVDMDSETTRALGQFLIDLAEQAEMNN
jgi:hypothetical protein